MRNIGMRQTEGFGSDYRPISVLEGLLRITFIKSNYLCIEQTHCTDDASGNCSNCAELHEEQIEKHFVEH